MAAMAAALWRAGRGGGGGDLLVAGHAVHLRREPRDWLEGRREGGSAARAYVARAHICVCMGWCARASAGSSVHSYKRTAAAPDCGCWLLVFTFQKHGSVS